MATACPLIERPYLQQRAWSPIAKKIPDAVWPTGGSQLQRPELPQRDQLASKVFALEERIKKIEARGIGFIKINLLPIKNLKVPLDAIVEPDDDGFIARTTDIPLYGYGDDPIEAVEALKFEIESLYDDLTVDDQFTDEWLRVKGFLQERIIA